MPSGVGAARTRVAHVLFATVLAAAGLVIAAPAAHAQAAPGITIQKIAVGGDVTAFFSINGPQFSSSAQAAATEGVPTVAVADPPLTGLALGTYSIQETGLSGAFQLTAITCTDPNATIDLQSSTATITLTEEASNVSCTFTDTLAGANILGQKVVTGNTSSWTRPAQFHISCPELQLDDDIQPPIGPGGPGTYIIGKGAIPPATCTISEIDTGSDGAVSVSMVMTNHGNLIATGSTAITFTSHVGDDLVLTVTNAFPPIDHPFPGDNGGGTTTTIAGGSTTTLATTTTVATSTTTGGGATTSGGATTTVPGGGSSSVAPTSAPSELPTTGSPTGGLLVAALIAMIAGVALVARTRRFVD